MTTLPFTPLGLDHVVLRVRDQAATQQFYIDVLGCTLERVNAPLSLIHLRFGEQLIDSLPCTGARCHVAVGPADVLRHDLAGLIEHLDLHAHEARHALSIVVDPARDVSGASELAPHLRLDSEDWPTKPRRRLS